MKLTVAIQIKTMVVEVSVVDIFTPNGNVKNLNARNRIAIYAAISSPFICCNNTLMEKLKQKRIKTEVTTASPRIVASLVIAISAATLSRDKLRSINEIEKITAKRF